jgi:cyclophilin family peptidyl-prolyl cis-trans isomerase
MNILKIFAASLLLVLGLAGQAVADPNQLTIQLKDGKVVIQLMPDVAPQHVARIKELAKNGAYDNVAFHRVIQGFMAQTGDVQYGNMKKNFQPQMAGMGGSELPDLPAEFSNVPFERGIIGMARAQDPNSANSQFFIMFAPGDFLNGQYTVVGKVVSGMEFVDKIKRGDPQTGAVPEPDRMLKVTVSK